VDSISARSRTLAVITAATLAAVICVPACSTTTEPAGTTSAGSPAPTATSAPATATTTAEPPGPPPPATVEQAADCGTNPETEPVPTAEPYAPVSEADQVTVQVTGIASGAVTPSEPTEIDVTVCNDSPVAYPHVGLVVALEHCSCADNPLQIPSGTVEYLDAGTGTWVALPHPVEGGGMDYLGQFTNAQDLPKGTSFTIRYRIVLDASMTDGDGGVTASVVTAEGPLNQIGTARLPFAVVSG
jgi:hypothetical protein